MMGGNEIGCTLWYADTCGGLGSQDGWHLLKGHLKEDVPFIMGHLDALGVKWVKIGQIGS
jgi:hypothetical protein